ncbi:DUF3081 family protein [Ferrimonas kyonanensis]|uniref:DUF3081 family protein n=1 Tax=Ferrimonas kyonanensis TaxID=364763 RepID=UPI00040A8623|nr:DUF3081 family protein [Ferrimonas kyonanensis]
MRNSLNCRTLLRVHQRVVDRGQWSDGRYGYLGLWAWSDFDGYTAFLGNDDVTLSVFFHNRYQFDYSDSAALAQFLAAVERVAELQ